MYVVRVSFGSLKRWFQRSMIFDLLKAPIRDSSWTFPCFWDGYWCFLLTYIYLYFLWLYAMIEIKRHLRFLKKHPTCFLFELFLLLLVQHQLNWQECMPAMSPQAVQVSKKLDLCKVAVIMWRENASSVLVFCCCLVLCASSWTWLDQKNGCDAAKVQYTEVVFNLFWLRSTYCHSTRICAGTPVVENFSSS